MLAGVRRLYFRQNCFLDLFDFALVALVEGPLLDPLGTCQTGLAQNPHVFACGRLADPELARNEATANSILYQIAVYLRRKVFCRVLKPLENLQSSVVRERPDYDSRHHNV